MREDFEFKRCKKIDEPFLAHQIQQTKTVLQSYGSNQETGVYTKKEDLFIAWKKGFPYRCS